MDENEQQPKEKYPWWTRIWLQAKIKSKQVNCMNFVCQNLKKKKICLG